MPERSTLSAFCGATLLLVLLPGPNLLSTYDSPFVVLLQQDDADSPQRSTASTRCFESG